MEKGTFVSNTGRSSKNTEDVMIFTKGKARPLRKGKMKDKADQTVQHYMFGSNGMLPTEFNFQPPSQKGRIHQAEKPVGLIASLIDYLTLEDETILDQFAGSGVVGEAFIHKNCKFILFRKGFF